MTPITHALLPAVLSSPLLPRSRPRDYYVSAGIIALAGVLPDIINPHLSLAARHSSWSHTVFAYAAFDVLLLVLALRAPKRFPPVIVMLASLAYLVHIVLDGISGGVAPLYPLSREVYRARLIPWRSWLYFDAAFLLSAGVVFWWLPNRRRNVRRRNMRADPA